MTDSKSKNMSQPFARLQADFLKSSVYPIRILRPMGQIIQLFVGILDQDITNIRNLWLLFKFAKNYFRVQQLYVNILQSGKLYTNSFQRNYLSNIPIGQAPHPVKAGRLEQHGCIWIVIDLPNILNYKSSCANVFIIGTVFTVAQRKNNILKI